MIPILTVLVGILALFVIAIAAYTRKIADKLNRLDGILAEHLENDPRYTKGTPKTDNASADYVLNRGREP